MDQDGKVQWNKMRYKLDFEEGRLKKTTHVATGLVGERMTKDHNIMATYNFENMHSDTDAFCQLPPLKPVRLLSFFSLPPAGLGLHSSIEQRERQVEADFAKLGEDFVSRGVAPSGSNDIVRFQEISEKVGDLIKEQNRSKALNSHEAAVAATNEKKGCKRKLKMGLRGRAVGI